VVSNGNEPNLGPLGLLMIVLSDLVTFSALGFGGAWYWIHYHNGPKGALVVGGLGGLVVAFIQIFRKAQRYLK
jgi:hypothetical protein